MSSKNIIGYFHICQKEGWQKSFDLIFPKIKSSGLYDATIEINIGIVNDIGHVIDDIKLNDPKFKIIFCKSAEEYERPTLYHMQKKATINPENYSYWYVHSKGISHWGNPNESCIIDWINLLVYWNIEQWKIAVRMLEKYDTYGCNAIEKQHYSGNFWWAKGIHLKELPEHIPDYYTAPEDWICIKNDKMFNIYSSGLQGHGHYKLSLSKDKYKLPYNFNIDAYYNLNSDLQWDDYERLIKHYFNHGQFENRKYKY